MYVIIAGGGIAGSAIATSLVQRKHDVVVVEQDRERCEHVYARIGAVMVNGSATDINTLKEAGIAKADVAIAALYRDSDNLTFTIMARSFNVPRIMVKMRDPAYLEAYKIAGATSICNQIELFRNNIMMELRNPNIRVITRLEDRNAQLIMIRFPASADSEGTRIIDLVKRDAFTKDCVFAGILRESEDQIVLPRGSDLVYPGDKLFLVANENRLPLISGFLSSMESAGKKR
jgi:trk system potassium uptake protein TrkA